MARRDKERYKNATVPAMPVESAVAYNRQLQELLGMKRDALQALAQQRAEIRAGYQTARTGIMRERTLGLQDVINQALERGILGSSAELERRIDVTAETGQRLAEALSARNQALLANMAQAMAARRNFAMGLANIAASRAAEQAMLNAQALYAGVGPFAGGPGFGGGGGGEAAGLAPRQREALQDITGDIRRMLDLIVTASPPAREKYIGALQDLWRRRNRMRKLYGLRPIPRQRMQELLRSV